MEPVAVRSYKLFVIVPYAEYFHRVLCMWSWVDKVMTDAMR